MRPVRRVFSCTNSKGFSLVEIAVVLVIVGLLAGGGVSLMGTFSKRKARNNTLDYLKQAKEAVISYTDINGRLPWADTDNDGNENTGSSSGNFPYATLNVRPVDVYKRVLRYEMNRRLGQDKPTSCNTLRTGLAGPPALVDADGSTSSFPVAAVLISAGPMDSDGDGDVFDDVTGAFQGDNTNGNPNYIRYPPTDTFDDMVAYVGGNELLGDICEYLVLAVNKGTSAPNTIYVHDRTRGIDLGRLSNGQTGSYDIISGTRIEIRSASGGGGTIVVSRPQTPVTLAGDGCTIDIDKYPATQPPKQLPKPKPLPKPKAIPFSASPFQ